MLIAILTFIGGFVVWLVMYNLVFVGIPTVLGKWYARSIRRTIPKTISIIWKFTVWLLKALLNLRHSDALSVKSTTQEGVLHATFEGKTDRELVTVPKQAYRPITIELHSSKIEEKK